MHGREGCMAGGACVAGGHAWWGVACVEGGVHGRGVCMAGGCAWQGVCMAGGHVCWGVHGRGHAWQGVCMAGGMHARGHAWWGGMHATHTHPQALQLWNMVNEQAVHILLECILVSLAFDTTFLLEIDIISDHTC